jgi:hypothetical protein
MYYYTDTLRAAVYLSLQLWFSSKIMYNVALCMRPVLVFYHIHSKVSKQMAFTADDNTVHIKIMSESTKAHVLCSLRSNPSGGRVLLCAVFTSVRVPVLFHFRKFDAHDCRWNFPHLTNVCSTANCVHSFHPHSSWFWSHKGMVWSDISKPTLIFFFSLQEYTQQNPLSKF